MIQYSSNNNNNNNNAMQKVLYKKYSLRCTRWGGGLFPSSASKYVSKRDFKGLICTENLESRYKTSVTSVQDHDTSYISTPVAIIRCTPHCNEILIEMVLVSFHDKLMSPRNQREIINMIKLSSAYLQRRARALPGQLYHQITIQLHEEKRPMFEYLESVMGTKVVVRTIRITPH